MAELIKVNKEELEELRKATPRHRNWILQNLIEDFCCSDEKVAEFKWKEGEYASASTAYSTLWKAVKRSHTAVNVRTIHKRIFLIKAGALDE